VRRPARMPARRWRPNLRNRIKFWTLRFSLQSAMRNRQRVSVFASILAVLAFGRCFAGWKVLDGIGRLMRENWKGSVVSQIKTKAARWGIASEAKDKASNRISSESITILKDSEYESSHGLRRQFSKVLLRDRAESVYEYGVTRYCSALPLFSYRTILFVSSSGKASLEGVDITNSRASCFASGRQDGSHSSPCELGGQVPTILEINDDFRVLSGVFRNYKISDHSIFSSNGDISSLANLQGVLASYKLLLDGFQLSYSSRRPNNYCQQTHGFNSKPYLVTCALLAFAGALGAYFGLWSLQFRVDGHRDWRSWAGLVMSIFVFAHFSN
jgi:hypothetical protein